MAGCVPEISAGMDSWRDEWMRGAWNPGKVNGMKVPDIKGMFSIARGALDPKKGQPAARADAPAGADKVELSSQGQAVQKLAAERSDTKVRAAFVAELRAQFLKDELKSDSQKTAAAMMDSGMFDDLITGR